MSTRTPSFTRLETERLLLRRFSDADLQPYLEYLNDPLVALYQSWETFSEQQTLEAIEQQKLLEPGQPGRCFTFAIEHKTTGILIGHVALTAKEQDPRQAEIGFTFSRAYQGQGFAKEAASRVLQYAFADLDMHRIVAIADCENERSVALLQTLGMRREAHFVKNIWFKGRWGSEFHYGLLREECSAEVVSRTI